MADKRLIDANALKKPIVNWLDWYTASVAVKSAVQEIVESIDEAPTIDAVEVVRCRECKEARACLASAKHRCCEYWDTVTSEDSYCYMGEKIDGGAE